MLETGDAPGKIVEERGLKQTSDTGAIEAVIADVLAKNPGQLEQYRGGKEALVRLLRRPDDEGDAGQGQPGGGQRFAQEGAGADDGYLIVIPAAALDQATSAPLLSSKRRAGSPIIRG